MTDEELREYCRKFNEGKPFLTQNKVMKMLGISHKTATELLKGLKPMYSRRRSSNPAKQYFVDDVVKAVIRKGF